MNYKLPAIGLVGLITFLILSCTLENDSNDRRLTIDSFTSLPMETIFEFTESGDIAFRFIRSMQMDSHGNVLINDPSQPVVFMFDSKGNLIQQIGKKGRGPGEFLNVGSVLVAHDSLAVSDRSSHKIEIFASRNERYEHIRTVSVKNQKLLGNLLGLTEKGILIENDIWLSPAALNNPTETAICLLGYDVKVLRDTLFSVLIHEFVLHDSEISFVRGKIYGNISQLAYDEIVC